VPDPESVKVSLFSLSDVSSVAEAVYEDECVLKLLGALGLTPLVRESGVLDGDVEIAV
jgi:hypothetical protein